VNCATQQAATLGNKMHVFFESSGSWLRVMGTWSNKGSGVLHISAQEKIRRAFAQGVSDHGPGAFGSTIVSTLPVPTLVSTVNNCQKPIQLFLQRFNNPISFSTPTLSPVHLFLQESRTVLQLLLEQLLLV